MNKTFVTSKSTVWAVINQLVNNYIYKIHMKQYFLKIFQRSFIAAHRRFNSQ